MGDMDLAMLREAWQKRAEQEQHKKDLLQKDAVEKAKQAAAFIKERYGASKVYLYGSLAWSRHFDTHSDIDLLVEGFTQPDKYWQMLCEVWKLVSPFPPSVVLAEDACPSLLEKVQKQGVELS
ncbi:MAG TPA: nucleotidyltransferase domain-containing protein [Firmicutes bacterium]|nr:nucleotidyltransferase domain-containing protein [Bacillota bacterium]